MIRVGSKRQSRGRVGPTSAPAPDAIDAATIAAFERGDADAFGRIARRYARELHVHCYRMLGSFDDAEDLVQETLMRAWNRRDSYVGRASVRAWLYRIATNRCIDAIRARAARGGAGSDEAVPPYTSVPWLQPYPDALLEAGSEDLLADARAVSRETIELAFLATIQGVPPKQRAVLILRDVLDFSANETAEILEDTVAAVNSALQRVRATLKRRRGSAARSARTVAPSFDEAVLLEAFMDAQDRGDVNAMVDLLRDDVRMTLFPDAVTWSGRDAVARELRVKRGELDGDVRSVPITANRQPALAVYVRRSTDVAYHAWAIVVLGSREGKFREIATFASSDMFARFGLPATLETSAA